jgi:hypothetical protein
MIDRIVSRLDGVRRTGPGRFVARCPAHADKSPSLSVTEKEGHVLFHCFAGCAPADVLAAIGLEFKDIYPERSVYRKAKSASFNPYDVLSCLVREAGIVELAARQLAAGHPLSDEDAERVTLAHTRIYDAAKIIGVRV